MSVQENFDSCEKTRKNVKMDIEVDESTKASRNSSFKNVRTSNLLSIYEPSKKMEMPSKKTYGPLIYPSMFSIREKLS